MPSGPTKVKPSAQGQKGNQSKRKKAEEEEGTGFSPETKKVNTAAPIRRARSQDLSKGSQAQARLTQSKMDSFVSPDGGTVSADKEKGGPGGSTSAPPNDAFPSLPRASPPPLSETHFPEAPTCAGSAVKEFYSMMCSVGTQLRQHNDESTEISLSDLAKMQAEMAKMQVYTCAAFGALMNDLYKHSATWAEVVQTQKGIIKEVNSVQANQTADQAKQVFEDDLSHAQHSIYLPRGQQLIPGLLEDLEDEKGRSPGVALLRDLWKFIREKASLANLGPFDEGMIVHCWVKKKKATRDQPAAAQVTIECRDVRAKMRLQQLLRRKIDLKTAAEGKVVPYLRSLPPSLSCATTVLDSRLKHRPANVPCNQAYNVISSTAHSLKHQGALSGFELSYVWSGKQPGLSLATRTGSDRRYTHRINFDPVAVLQEPSDKGKQYISRQIKGKLPHADLNGVFTEDFDKRLQGARDSYKSIMDTFSAARVRRKMKLKGKGGGQKGEGSGAQSVEGNISHVQRGEKEKGSVSPPVTADSQT